ncbi:MAG: AAA family ATPase [Caldilineaceae bacterium]|nr:AAA family ATPase [Caldilineaceae bacterium]
MPQSAHASSRPSTGGQARILIYTFGTLQVIRGETAVTESDWHTRQARQLLKILITERPRPVSTDLLIELLWPNSTPNAAATTLRSAINALRNVLEPDRPNRAPSRYIATQAPGYAFHSAPEIWLDVEQFEQLLNKAHDTVDPTQRLSLLEQAIDLYQDDYLISDPYADWLQTERERLRERLFNALLEAAELYAEKGHYADAIASCRQLLARDEVRENAYQALMRYQAESGDSAGALLTYERCRTLLLEELGADPSPVTQTLHQRVLNGEIEPRPVVHKPAQTHGTNIGQNAPPAAHQAPELPQRTLLTVLDTFFPSMFVGREKERVWLAERLQAALHGSGALAIIDGEAGVGKTRLAYQVLQRAAKQAATVISATCQVLERELPFAPLADALGRYFYGLPDTVVRSLPAASISQLGQIIPSLQDRLQPSVPAPNDSMTSAEENRQRLIDSIVTLAATLASLRPLVLFLDDLQWADPDTIAVLNRLVQRLPEAPIFLMLAYRSEELAENEALSTLLHTLNRTQRGCFLSLERFAPEQVRELVQSHLGAGADVTEISALLYDTTRGNALFVSEALRDLDERRAAAGENQPLVALLRDEPDAAQASPTLRHSQRIQKTILERVDRLPQEARHVLNLCAVIGRDFSPELLEAAATQDPLIPLEILLERRFLVERPDDRLDFAHHLVRQTVYEGMSTLQRRRLHCAVADALVKLGHSSTNPGEIAFHYTHAGSAYRVQAAHYGVETGARLLSSYGFRQAVDTFSRVLESLQTLPDAPPELTGRALQGLGLSYEALFDTEGVTTTYRRLQNWARSQGDRQLILATYSRLATMLALLGQQAESNVQLDELLRALTNDGAAVPSRVLVDLLQRRQLLYRPDTATESTEWTCYEPAAPPVPDPVADVLQILEPIHAVPPLFDYGWTLLVQGQLGEATRVLEAVVDLATETSQASIASAAYHQLAVTARILGDLEQSQALNEESIAINRAVSGTASELASMWPRISSAFLSLHAGRLDEAERRLRRVADFLGARKTFRNYRQSADIGLGLVALARGNLDEAQKLLARALDDPFNLYPYTHAHGLLGLARIAHARDDVVNRDALLRQALRFAGKRSLLEEYIAIIGEVACVRPEGAPVPDLIDSVLAYVRAIQLETAVEMLEGLRDQLAMPYSAQAGSRGS